MAENMEKVVTISALLGFSISLLLSMNASTQTLSLFEEIENNNEASSRQRERQSGGAGSSNSSPEFTLIGTSRIGESYSVIVKHRGGEFIVVAKELGSEIAIPGYQNYRLVEVGPAFVSIMYPEDIACYEASELGVYCDDNLENLARLTLANAEPLASGYSSSGFVVGSDLVEDREQEQNPTNPFEALLEGSSNPEPNDSDNSFTPRRINPEDVPPGMRIVSTPFGDRLVENDQ